MNIKIPFGKAFLDLKIEDEKVLYVARADKPVKKNDDDIVRNALDNPVGTDRLENMVKTEDNILILMDDITRPTPKKLLLTHVLKRLEKLKIKDSQISIAFALGTHRTMTEEEILEVLGAEFKNRFKIININYLDLDRFAFFGYSKNNIKIEVYKEVLETDFLIGLGNITPHISAGWGGGAKIVQPGVCGEITTEGTHLMSCLEQDVMDTCANAENKVRLEMEDIARRVGLKFILNTILDEHGNLLHAVSGDLLHAHRSGVEFAKTVFCPVIEEKAKIVVASANPCNLDFWQGAKPYIFAQYGLKDNGTIIFVIDAKEGLCGNAPSHETILRKYSNSTFAEIKRDIDNGLIDDLIAVDGPIFQAQIRARGVKTILVSKGMTKQDASDLGFIYAADLNEALEKAYELEGMDAKIGIIPYAGDTVVQVK